MRRAKIVCTLGPATGTPEMIGALMDAGMDVARLNFSHGSHESHAATIRMVRAEAQRRGRAVAYVPASRVAEMNASSQVQVVLPDGQLLTPTAREMQPTADPVSQTVEWRLPLPAI